MKYKIKRLFWSGGLDDSEYKTIISDIDRHNRQMALIFSIFAIVLTVLMTFMSIRNPSFANSKKVYIGGIFASTFILILAIFGKYKSNLITWAVYIAENFYLAYGFVLGIFTRPDQQTTTFMVLMILLPLIFVDRPIKTIIITYVWIIAFTIGVIFVKPKELISVDITDAWIFGLLASAAGTTVIRSKLREFLMEKKLHIMSTKDQLTSLNNRNCYEWMVKAYPNLCSKSLCCIYIDVNGLHELNNTVGHEAGDKMLQEIAEAVINEFGTQHTYRIGGDEYIAFVPDSTANEINAHVQELKYNVEKRRYHIAVGVEKQSIDVLDMDRLIKKAEMRMYKNKEEYYQKLGKEHR